MLTNKQRKIFIITATSTLLLANRRVESGAGVNTAHLWQEE
jgi:hypothetical protein